MRQKENASIFSNLGIAFKKPFRTKRITVLNLTITALLLALTLMANFIAQFLKFNPILNFDFSLIFVFVAFFFLGWFNGSIVILTRFVLGPLLSGTGAILPASYLGHFILLITHLIYITTFTIAYKIFKNIVTKKNYDKLNYSYIEKNSIEKITIIQFFTRHILVFAITILITTILITLANVFFLTPLFFWIFSKLGFLAGTQASPLLNSFLETYNSSSSGYNAFFFFIPNYFGGAFALFISFNFANLAINSSIIAIILFTDYSTGIFSKLKGETIDRY